MSRALPDGLHLGRRDRGLIPVIAAVAAIASLALGGWNAARSLSREWRTGAGQQVTIEIPDFTGEAHRKAERLVKVLGADPGVDSISILSEDDLRTVLRPWLGTMQARLSDLPEILTMTRRPGHPRTNLPAVLDTLAPGAIVEENATWGARLSLLGESLQACAWLAVMLAGIATAGVTTLSVRVTLIARRRTIEILHGLGAADSLIARRIAWRSASLGLAGGAIGMVLGYAALAILHRLVLPFLDHQGGEHALWPSGIAEWISALLSIPASLIQSLLGVPVLVALLSFVVAQGTVRLWLRRLP
ncbi:cell division protein FtsX [Swaminathania salitolerans]|uniref:Cell division protein FtsX n=1 Tax=Swaminathania salitolerans TaxID=182838 RepID=A0A511BUF8_9PROT|nr:FtsX-like permease family protein [Swaminathania salitolerans]GBQ12683.1 cell division protein FtsX [Swaminathania salitolerans LMG 21291]GEL03134.1 cell division protein FtsX [Swaminathania salitolerans]